MSATGNTGRHRLVRASAGTGKTYALTTRYLELLIGGARPEHMLATTFTRKAAREILERVLGRLVKAIDDPAERAALGRDLSREQCVRALASLVRHLDRVHVATLDAFFAERAREAELDLGLAPGWRIADELEEEELRLDAIEGAIATAKDLEWLDVLRDLQRAPADLAVQATLARLFEGARRVTLESRADAWTRVAPTPDVPDTVVEGAAAELAELALPATKSGGVDRHWKKNVDDCLQAVRERDFEALLEISLIKKVAAKEAMFSRHPITIAHAAALEALLARAVHVSTAKLALQNAAARDLAARLEQHYAVLQFVRGVYRFDDLPRALVEHEAAARVGASIDHLFLDEFQDTSPIQWRALRPRADVIVASDDGARTFFCVGDAKQSIYGWREAEPRLMESLVARYPVLDVRSLATSYRSSAVVIDTVNRVFGCIESNPALARKNVEAELAAARDFQRAFERHAAHKDLSGSAVLCEVAANAENGGSPLLARAVELVARALEERPGCTVAVLVRGGAIIPEILHGLRARGIAASGEGGNPLSDSAAVLAMLSLFHLADHPADTAAAFHVATSPFAGALEVDVETIGARRVALAREVRSAVARRGLGDFVSSRANAVRGSLGAFDRGRLEALVELAFAFESRAPFRLSAFVEHVRREPVEDASSARVKVMTVHKSKGLEFDVVILPELDGSFRRRSQRLWTERSDPSGPIEIATHVASKIVADRHPILARLSADACRRDLLEELCVLYVAMTRAIHELHMIVPAAKEESEALTAAAILRAALAPETVAQDGVLWRHPDGASAREPIELEPACAPRGAAVPSDAVAPTDVAAPSDAGARRIRFAAAPAARASGTSLRAGAAGRSPSTEVARPKMRAFATLRARSSTRARGILVHRWLAEVEWLEDFDASDAELLAIARPIEADASVVRDSLAAFRAAIASDELRAVLSREAQRASDVDAWRERRFAVVLPNDDGAEDVWSGAFDRVHLVREDGRIASAVVFDFKTGGDPEHYAPQMAAYRRVLAHMTGLEERAIETRVVMIAPQE